MPLTFLLYAGATAAIVAAITLTANALSAILAEDAILGLRWEPPGAGIRLLLARGCVAIVMTLAALAAMIMPTDPVDLVIAAMSICAATAFPVVVLAVWYKRLSPLGAATGLALGFALSLGALMSGLQTVLGYPVTLAGVAIAPLTALVAVGVSRVTPKTDRVALERVRDMRIPGGETIYDREARLLRLKETTL